MSGSSAWLRVAVSPVFPTVTVISTGLVGVVTPAAYSAVTVAETESPSPAWLGDTVSVIPLSLSVMVKKVLSTV